MAPLPTTAARTVDGVMAFMNAALGLRLAADFFGAFLAGAFFAGAFLAADFFAAGFLAPDFFAAGFFAADFFAAFLAVAIDSPSCRLCERTTPEHSEAGPPVTGRVAPSAATIPHFRGKGSVLRGKIDVARAGCCTRANACSHDRRAR